MVSLQNGCILYMYIFHKNYLSRSIGESISTCKCLWVHFMIRVTQFTSVDAVLVCRSNIVWHAAMFHEAPYFTSAFFPHRERFKHVTLERISLYSGLESQNPAVTCERTKVMFFIIKSHIFTSRLPCLIKTQRKNRIVFFALIFK